MRLNGKERFAGLAASPGFNHDAPEPPLELSSLLMFQRPEQHAISIRVAVFGEHS